MLEATFETSRERVSVCEACVDSIPATCSTHVFAVCVTRDGVPLVGVRRTSFAYQAVTLRRRNANITPVARELLRYMYASELKDIYSRLPRSCRLRAPEGVRFEELVLLGGCLHKQESVTECLAREIREESDSRLSARRFGARALKICIFDKLLTKQYSGYCMLCFVEQRLDDVQHATLYNFEVCRLCSLLEKSDNEKFEYLHFIYNSLVTTK
ncbi:MC098R [Molluscum contagiosum virus subtype 1]|uniref:MC098R n=3 Tax=Molluscum contagiosum virus TaxID=10279 RepID=Q98265_MCV1|nr:MC098R [Molluscum contagiosum virus subtype 1]AZT86289.1 MC098R [Molluscum contagiosum virus]AAC55226.1 MC098R [Molluscum contagiosum virus subtype 1]AQY16847.1 MC098 [Molluscum contagiosum virus subtype 1]AQY17026.1 MC098 [Molluscum contagiosum virus subtype 1]AQY17205.1 MC098 [Molluscum contagiosum virus subtype 1]